MAVPTTGIREAKAIIVPQKSGEIPAIHKPIPPANPWATAVAQGFAGGIGLWIAGISPLFWGTMMAFASLIPVVGTAIIWLPAVVYLVLIGSWGKAVFLAIWSMVVVGSIDNFLRPFLMKGEGGISSIYLFFAILGGINLFGIVGILYGPLILGVAAILLYLYELEYGEVLAEE